MTKVPICWRKDGKKADRLETSDSYEVIIMGGNGGNSAFSMAVVGGEDGVDHGGGGVGKACGGGRQLARVSCEVEMGQGWGCIM